MFIRNVLLCCHLLAGALCVVRAGDEIVARTFHSEALGRDVPYSVFVPRGPAPAGGWPLVLVLHGAGRNLRTLADDAETRAAILKSRVALLFADGQLGWWIDSPVRAESRYQTMLAEFLALARRELPVARDSAHTGVCGWSMGGFGSVRFAEDHPTEVRAVATVIALLDFPNPGLPAAENHIVSPLFGTDPSGWARFNCTVSADALRGKALFMIAGRAAFDFRINRNFHDRLTALAIPHEYRELDGGHTFPVVRAAWPQMLRFMEEQLGARDETSVSPK